MLIYFFLIYNTYNTFIQSTAVIVQENFYVKSSFFFGKHETRVLRFKEDLALMQI